MLKAASVACTDKDKERRPARHAARGGPGAVMGSKCLKWVVIDPGKARTRQPADPKRFNELCKAYSKDYLSKRHELFKKKYPDQPNAKGIPYTGLENARPETKRIADRVRELIQVMPFDVEEYLKFDVPGSDAVGDWGR